MLELLATVGLVLAAATIVGAALWRLAGLNPESPAAPAVGFAALLIVAEATIRLPGRAVTSAVVLGLALLASAAYLWWRRARVLPAPWIVLLVLGVLLCALIPFAASGRVGLLGVGTNDDTAQHLLAAWTLQGHAPLSASQLVSDGYPVAPHALMATISEATGISLERAFTGITLTVPVLLALSAAALMTQGPRVLRGILAACVGLCYLQAAFLVQASFKEPIEALMLVALTATLYEPAARGSRGPFRAIPLGVLMAGAVYAYSYPGAVWLAGTLVICWAIGRVWSAAGRGGADRGAADRAALPPASVRLSISDLAATGVLALVLVAPEIPRLIDFANSGYNHEGSAVFGNLVHTLPPQEALGIWPALDFRFGIPVLSLRGIAMLVMLAVLVLTVLRCLRRRDYVLPVAFLVATGLWGISATRSPYTAAKCLAIVAPLVILLVGRELLVLVAGARRPVSWQAAGAVLAGALVALAAYSDLDVLRDGPVGPSSHAAQLASLRSAIGHQPTLFLGADDFVHWELRGGDVATPPMPLYARVVVPLRRGKARQNDPRLYRGSHSQTTTNRFSALGLGLDFDSVPDAVLDRFTYVIATRSTYASVPPPNWRLVRSTPSYGLWHRTGPTPDHGTLTEVDNPGAVLDCTAAAGRSLAARPGFAMVRTPPVVIERWAWQGDIASAGGSARIVIPLPRGTWDLSLQYDSTVDVTLTGPGLHTELPASLEPLGPYWAAGRLHLARRRRVHITLVHGRLPLLGRILGASGLARSPTPTGLIVRGRLVANKAPFGDRRVPLSQACGRYVDWYRVLPS